MQRSGSSGFALSDVEQQLRELQAQAAQAMQDGAGAANFEWVSLALLDPSCSYEIGVGTSARVYAVRHPVTKEAVAVKRMDRCPMSQDPTKLHSFQKEVEIFSKLRHPNIIRLLAVQHEPDSHLLVMELAESELKGELEQGPLPESEACGYFSQIAAAVDYCHRQSVCHRDLKLENVMLMEDNETVKVTDFGMGKDWQTHSGPKTQQVGSFAYMAPEVVDGDGEEYDGAPVDVWSMGVMLYVMTVCNYPFGGLSENESLRFKEMDDIRRNILQANARIDATGFFPDSMSASLQDLIRGMLQPDVKRRLTTQQILQHAWLNGNRQQPSEWQDRGIAFNQAFNGESNPTVASVSSPVNIDWSLVPPYQCSNGSDVARVFDSEPSDDDMYLDDC